MTREGIFPTPAMAAGVQKEKGEKITICARCALAYEDKEYCPRCGSYEVVGVSDATPVECPKCGRRDRIAIVASAPDPELMCDICGHSFHKPETDPTGREAGDPGAKLDQGKVRLGLVLGGFANALREVGEVGTFGAAKYSDNGWKEVPRAAERYTDAMLRHWQKMAIGELVDPDSGLLHAAHMAWNALAVLEKLLAPEPTSFEYPDEIERADVG